MADGLFTSLLDPTLTPIQICELHNLTLTQLHTIMQSDEYKQAAESIREINAQRAQLIADNERTQAMSLHTDIARDAYLAAKDIDELTASRNPKLAAVRARLIETARKANTKLLYKPPASTSGDHQGAVSSPSPSSPIAFPAPRGRCRVPEAEGVLIHLKSQPPAPPQRDPIRHAEDGVPPSPRGGEGNQTLPSPPFPPPTSARPRFWYTLRSPHSLF